MYKQKYVKGWNIKWLVIRDLAHARKEVESLWLYINFKGKPQ